MTLCAPKQFRVLPISIFCHTVVFSGVNVCDTNKRCQSWPWTIISGIAGIARPCAGWGLLRSYSGSSRSLVRREVIQMPSCALPSVHDLFGAFVSMFTAIGLARTSLRVVLFQLLMPALGSGRRRDHAAVIFSSGFRV